MGGFTVIIGLLISHQETSFGQFLHDPVNTFIAFAGFLIFFLVAGGTNTINDYFDLPIDKINRPNRPLSRGAESPGPEAREGRSSARIYATSQR